MARPRKDEARPSAYERMTAAFWSLLGEKSYSAVTVKLITQQAGVNHNTFYYHFENIDDMAVKMLESVIPTRLVDMMAAVSMGQPLDLSAVRNAPELGEHYQKIRAIVRSGSFDLGQMSKNRLMHCWLERAGLDEDEFSRVDRARVNYIWGGITAVISSDEAETLEDYLELLQSGIIDAVGMVIRRIGQDHGVNPDAGTASANA